MQALSGSLVGAQFCPKSQEYSQLASIVVPRLLGRLKVPLEGKIVPAQVACAFCKPVLDCTGNHRLLSHLTHKSTDGFLCSSKSKLWPCQCSKALQHRTMQAKSSIRQLASYCCPRLTPLVRCKDCSTARTEQIRQGDSAYCRKRSEISRPFSWIDSGGTSEWSIVDWKAKIASHLWSCAT